MNIILLEPEIPQNTGNIARLSVAIGAELWLVGRLGFSLTDKYTRRAGMDYWQHVKLRRIDTLAEFYPLIDDTFAFISTHGQQNYIAMPLNINSIVFGNEGTGFPERVYEKYSAQLYRIPMLPDTRSLNLATSTGIVAYHLLERGGFAGLG
ncbi:tRNA (cytidine(34)-2'-O)-methyltransferase [Deferribacterales bacterium RsTz2092]|nr:putative tRNA (cytidine(34)-2'-O)-methyltransferase [Deferribacterales bacterium]